ncbi:ParB/RepB/Spo0J family partition protein [Candidatus Bathyarchaeota archaeon]|nr:ParB/RepB/Spo0J family partition protein [Candidatus Bathyarchaeota archaeon]
MKKVQQISVEAIRPDPNQPRKNFNEEAIFELAQSIKKNGLLQPITVKKNCDGYIIVAGERRYKAVCSLEWETIECIVYNGNNTKELQLIENINRADLNPMEVVTAYQAYLIDHTIEELSEVVGKPKNTISWLLNLSKVRPEVQHMVAHNQISMVAAIGLSKLTNTGQSQGLRMMQSNKLSVAECQKLTEVIYAQENQVEMFPEEPKLDKKEQEARVKVQTALDRACQAFQEINKIELDNPGITAQAIADRLDITQEKVEMLYKLVGQFKSNLQIRRVKALC